MTDIETKALALVKDCGGDVLVVVRNGNAWVEALCRAIEQHEAFKQEVSDAVENVQTPMEIICPCTRKHVVAFNLFDHFIIPKPKPDPLVEVLLEELAWDEGAVDEYAGHIRAALDARGFEIREKNDD